MPWTQRDLDFVAARLLPDIYDINQRLKYERNTKRLRSLLSELEPMKFRITEPTFFLHKERQPGESLDFPVGPHRNTVVGGHGLVRVPQFEEITEANPMSVIDRIKAKALQARDIVPTAIKEFEADLDSIIAGGPMLAEKRAAAVGPHREATKGLLTEIDGLKGAMDILSNGDPLPASGDSVPK